MNSSLDRCNLAWKEDEPKCISFHFLHHFFPSHLVLINFRCIPRYMQAMVVSHIHKNSLWASFIEIYVLFCLGPKTYCNCIFSYVRKINSRSRWVLNKRLNIIRLCKRYDLYIAFNLSVYPSVSKTVFGRPKL